MRKFKAIGATAMAEALNQVLYAGGAHSGRSWQRLAKTPGEVIPVPARGDNTQAGVDMRRPYSEAPHHTREQLEYGTTNEVAHITPEDFAAMQREVLALDGNVRIMPERPNVGKTYGLGVFTADLAADKRLREEQGRKISKLSAIIKRIEPRLFMEVLQDFGSLEGLSSAKQATLIARLEKIHQDYRL